MHAPNMAHWVVLNNINFYVEGKLFLDSLILDSLNHVSYTKSLHNTIVQICSRNTAAKSRIEIYTVNVELQVG